MYLPWIYSSQVQLSGDVELSCEWGQSPPPVQCSNVDTHPAVALTVCYIAAEGPGVHILSQQSANTVSDHLTLHTQSVR